MDSPNDYSARELADIADEQFQAEFERRAGDPKWWLRNAFALKESADLILSDLQMHYSQTNHQQFVARLQGTMPTSSHGYFMVERQDVAFMLLGLAIEALVKAVIVRDASELFDDNGIFKWKRHLDVNMVSKDAGIKLDPDERGVVEALNCFIKWQGKYPIKLAFSPPNRRGDGTPIGKKEPSLIPAATDLFYRLAFEVRNPPYGPGWNWGEDD